MRGSLRVRGRGAEDDAMNVGSRLNTVHECVRHFVLLPRAIRCWIRGGKLAISILFYKRDFAALPTSVRRRTPGALFRGSSACHRARGGSGLLARSGSDRSVITLTLPREDTLCFCL